MSKKSSRPFWLGEDSRGWDHVRIHTTLFKDSRLGAHDIAVYGGIAIHAELQTGNARPSVATLATYTGLSERTVFRVLTHLRLCGYIHIEQRQGKASKYTLLPPPVVETPASVSDVTDGTPDTDDTTPLTDVPHTPDTGSDEQEPENENHELPKSLSRFRKPKTFIDENGVKFTHDPVTKQWVEEVNSA